MERERREKCISVVVNDERGVPAAVIAGKLCYYEQPAKKWRHARPLLWLTKRKKNVEKGGKRRKKNDDEEKRERNRITIRRYLLFHRNWSLSFYSPPPPPQSVPCHRFSESLTFSAASLYRFVSPRLWAFVILFNIYSLTVHVPGQFPGAPTTIQNIIEYRPIIATVLSLLSFRCIWLLENSAANCRRRESWIANSRGNTNYND